MFRKTPAALAWLIGAAMAGIDNAGKHALDALMRSPRAQSFSSRYGNNPKAYNGGTRSGAASIKRQAKKRANIRKHPRSVA